MKPSNILRAALAGLCLPLSVHTLAQTDKSIANLTMKPTMLDFEGEKRSGRMYMPSMAALSDSKPAWVKKEPTYRSAPKYGVILLGNGPKQAHAFAVDAPDGADAKIYIDLKGDGDLTSSGDGAWPIKQVVDGVTNYEGTFVFRCSYGTDKKETTHDD